MKHMNPKLAGLLIEGFSINTLENLTSKQIEVLYEKVKSSKGEVEEQPKPVERTVTSKVTELPSGAKLPIGSDTVSNEGGKTIITQTQEGEFTEGEEEDVSDVNKGEDDQDPIQKQGDDGMPTETSIQEKAVSKQQQKIMGLALSVKKGDTPKSKVSKKVQDMAKEMSKKDLEDFASTKHKGLPKKVEATEGDKKFIQKAMTKMENKGTEGTFKKYCGGEVTMNCIKKGLKSDDPKIVKRANFAKNIGGYKGAEHNEVKNLEESIMKIIQNHLPPHTTKGELLKSLNKRKG